MFRLAVSAINGVEDAVESPLDRRQADPRFRELLAVWTRLRKQRALGLKRSDDGAGNAAIVLYLNEGNANDETRRDIDFLRSTLHLDPEAGQYRLRYGLVRFSTLVLV